MQASLYSAIDQRERRLIVLLSRFSFCARGARRGTLETAETTGCFLTKTRVPLACLKLMTHERFAPSPLQS